MISEMRKYFAKRLVRQLIKRATRAIYSEQFDFEAVVSSLSCDSRGITLVRTYIAIQTATQLTEPLNSTDVDLAFDALSIAAERSDSPEFGSIVDVHKELARLRWGQKNREVLDGKLANKKNPYSYEGAIYGWEFAKRGPLSSQKRTECKLLCKRIADLEERQREALKELDFPAYDKLMEALILSMKDDLERCKKNCDDWLEYSGVEYELERKLDSLLHKQ